MIDERRLILTDELSLETMGAILLLLEPLWDPFAHLGPVHLDLSDVTFIWPAVITLLTTAVLRLRQDGFEMRFTRPASEGVVVVVRAEDLETGLSELAARLGG